MLLPVNDAVLAAWPRRKAHETARVAEEEAAAAPCCPAWLAGWLGLQSDALILFQQHNTKRAEVRPLCDKTRLLDRITLPCCPSIFALFYLKVACVLPGLSVLACLSVCLSVCLPACPLPLTHLTRLVPGPLYRKTLSEPLRNTSAPEDGESDGVTDWLTVCVTVCLCVTASGSGSLALNSPHARSTVDLRQPNTPHPHLHPTDPLTNHPPTQQAQEASKPPGLPSLQAFTPARHPTLKHHHRQHQPTSLPLPRLPQSYTDRCIHCLPRQHQQHAATLLDPRPHRTYGTPPPALRAPLPKLPHADLENTDFLILTPLAATARNIFAPLPLSLLPPWQTLSGSPSSVPSSKSPPAM